MMRAAWILAGLFLLVAACGSDQDLGLRYRTERELWQANWEFRNLSIRPQEARDAQWEELARRYEGIAERASLLKTGEDDGAGEDVQILAAQAMFAAARIHGQLEDSTRADAIFRKMAGDFGHLPEVAAEVALAQGSVAERRGRLLEAVELYQAVVNDLAPRPGHAGAAGLVINLPIRIAHLKAREAEASREDLPLYLLPARDYYMRLLETEDDLVRIEALDRLAMVSVDMGDWDAAVGHMRGLEEQLLGMDNPPRDASEVRFAIARFRRQAGAGPEEVRQSLQSLLDDYPGSVVTPQVLIALSENADRRGELEEALGYIDRVIREYRSDEDMVPQAMFLKAKLLAGRDRWGEAKEIFRALPHQHPLSEPALLAPLEIASHYHNAGDDLAATEALEQAERGYRDFITRYPPGQYTISARNRLIQALLLQEKYDSAIDEHVSLARDMRGSPQSVHLMITAAGIARDILEDPTRAADILDTMAEIYQGDEIGAWASEEAARIRATAP